MPQVFPSCVVATGGDDGSAPKKQNLYNKYKVGWFIAAVLLIVWLVARPAHVPATDGFNHNGYSYFARSPSTTSSDLQWGAACDQGDDNFDKQFQQLFDMPRRPTGAACWSNLTCKSNCCRDVIRQGIMSIPGVCA